MFQESLKLTFIGEHHIYKASATVFSLFPQFAPNMKKNQDLRKKLVRIDDFFFKKKVLL